MKAQIQWTIIRFFTGTIYVKLIFQLCTQHFSTTILSVRVLIICVLTFWSSSC